MFVTSKDQKIRNSGPIISSGDPAVSRTAVVRSGPRLPYRYHWYSTGIRIIVGGNGGTKQVINWQNYHASKVYSQEIFMPSDTSLPPSRLDPPVNPPALNERRIWGCNPIVINV